MSGEQIFFKEQDLVMFLHCSRLKSTLSVLSGRIEKERAYHTDNDDPAFTSYL
jgi:hypothetical protein